MKIACDTGVSRAAIEVLQQHGHEVVYWASTEPDEWWFKDASAKGAEVFVSNDWDIILMADEHGKERVHLRNGIAGSKQAEPILRGLRKIDGRKHA